VNRQALLLLPLLLAAEGCSVVLAPGEAQCETTADCTARGFADAICTSNVCEKAPVIDPVWGCLGSVVEAMPDKTKKVALSVKLTFAGDKSPVVGVNVDVCDKLDIDCTGTNPDSPKGLMSGPDGLVSFSVAQGFDGFVRLASPQIIDSRIFVGRPIITPPTIKEVRLLSKNDFTILANLAKEKADPTRGTSILLAVDCQALPVSGARFESPSIDAMSREFYLINQAPTTPPAATATDVDGFGGFFNMPVGSAVARSFRASDDTFVGESSFHILAETISYVQIAPTPK
jgi:hypothetical protein